MRKLGFKGCLVLVWRGVWFIPALVFVGMVLAGTFILSLVFHLSFKEAVDTARQIKQIYI